MEYTYQPNIELITNTVEQQLMHALERLEPELGLGAEETDFVRDKPIEMVSFDPRDAAAAEIDAAVLAGIGVEKLEDCKVVNQIVDTDSDAVTMELRRVRAVELDTESILIQRSCVNTDAFSRVTYSMQRLGKRDTLAIQKLSSNLVNS